MLHRGGRHGPPRKLPKTPPCGGATTLIESTVGASPGCPPGVLHAPHDPRRPSPRTSCPRRQHARSSRSSSRSTAAPRAGSTPRPRASTSPAASRTGWRCTSCATRGKAGELQPGGMIVEATSGNTGISFAAIGRALGHPVTIFMPDWMSAERIALIRSFGATIRLVSKEEGGFLGSIALAEALAQARRRGVPPASVRQRTELRRAHAHHRSRDLGTTAQRGAQPSRLRGRRRHRRHHHGDRPLPAGACSRRSSCIRSSRRTPRRSRPGTRSASIASRGSATSSSRPIVQLDELDRGARGRRWRCDPDGAGARAANSASPSASPAGRTSSPRSRRRTRSAPTPWWPRSSATPTRST